MNQTRPKPLTCGQCGVEKDAWVFYPADVEVDLRNGDAYPGWHFDDEWWVDPKYFWEPSSYCCSKFCYLLRAEAAGVKP